MIEQALQQYLSHLTSITGRLATWRFASNGVAEPAVFTSTPEGATYPAIQIALVGGSGEGCRDSKGGEFRLDVDILGDDVRSIAALSTLARDVWLALDRADLTEYLEEGWTTYGVIASPPQRTSIGPGAYPQFTVQVVVRLLAPKGE